MGSRALRAVVALAIAVLIAAGFSVPAQAAGGPAGEAFTMVNQQRAQNGLGPLMTDPVLDNAATAWANYLASTGQFIHSSASWRSAMIGGAGWTFSGENIAAGYPTAATVMNAWMNSAGHRANILNSSYVGVGVGYVYVPGSQYGHYWVQIFAGSQPRVTPGNTPTISGTPAVGQTLTASSSGWQSGTSLSWTWQSNGVTIPGATGATYMPTISDAGRKLTATATGWISGYWPATKISNSSATITGGAVSTRLAGSTRFDTSAIISQSGFSPGVPVAYVAAGRSFPDALAAAPAASLLGGPLLLTEQATLPAPVAAELVRLAPQRIVLVGGPASVSDAVLLELQGIAPTTRIDGANRYEAARNIVEDAFESSSIAYIATGVGYPDALTASAAAAHLGAPVILVNGGLSTLDEYTIPLLQSLGVTTVRIAGGPVSVSPGIQTALSNAGFAVDRRTGANRYEVAISINQQAFGSATRVYLASGKSFPDALSGAALAGSRNAPLYLSNTGCIPSGVSKAITVTGSRDVVLLGGTATLTAQVANFQRC